MKILIFPRGSYFTASVENFTYWCK